MLNGGNQSSTNSMFPFSLLLLLFSCNFVKITPPFFFCLAVSTGQEQIRASAKKSARRSGLAPRVDVLQVSLVWLYGLNCSDSQWAHFHCAASRRKDRVACSCSLALQWPLRSGVVSGYKRPVSPLQSLWEVRMTARCPFEPGGQLREHLYSVTI